MSEQDSRRYKGQAKEAYGGNDAYESSCYVVDGDEILIAGVPTTVVPLRLRYWPVAPVISSEAAPRGKASLITY